MRCFSKWVAIFSLWALPLYATVDVDGLVDEISQKLLNKAMTFETQVPEVLYENFKYGMNRYRDIVLEAEKPNLDLISRKAEALYQEGNLTSRWLMFMAACCVELPNSLGDARFRSDGGIENVFGSTTEERLYRFSWFHENRKEVLKSFIPYEKRTRSRFPSGGYDYAPFEIEGNNFTLKCGRDARDLLFFATGRCYGVPIFGDDCLFSKDTLSKAFAHRIALAGVPFGLAEFDSSINNSPKKFFYHDLGHAEFLCLSQEFEEDTFDLEKDPKAKFWHRLWFHVEGMSEGLEKEADREVFFYLIHENGAESFGVPENLEAKLANDTSIERTFGDFSSLEDFAASNPGASCMYDHLKKIAEDRVQSLRDRGVQGLSLDPKDMDQSYWTTWNSMVEAFIARHKQVF